MYIRQNFSLIALFSLAGLLFVSLLGEAASVSVTIFYLLVLVYLFYLASVTDDVFVHPLLLFSLTYVFIVLSSFSSDTANPTILFLYFSCYVGYVVGWHISSKRVNFNLKSIRFSYMKPTSFALVALFLLVAAFQFNIAIYIALIVAHIAAAVYVTRSKSALKWFLPVLVAGFSFLLGKIVLLRLFILFYFADRFVSKRKRPLAVYAVLAIVMAGLFIAFNYRRFLLEGNIDYVELGALALMNIDVLMTLLVAGSDYFWSLRQLVEGEWAEFGSFGLTYLSAPLKFFPQSIFFFRPDSGNFVMNSYLFDGYEKNSYTMAATFVGELYINFGRFACVGAVLLGLVLKQVYLTAKLAAEGSRSGWLYLACFFALQFSLVRDDFNVSFGTFILYAAVIYIFVGRQKASES